MPLLVRKYYRVLLGLLLLTLPLGLLGFTPEAETAGRAPQTEVPLPGNVEFTRAEHGSPAAHDFNGDGYKEIVVAGLDGQFHVASYDGNSWSIVFSRQTVTDINATPGAPNCGTTGEINSTPSIADLDGDGNAEIVITSGGDIAKHYDGGVLVYKYDGAWSFSVVSGWPQPKLDIVGAGPGAGDPDGCWDGIWSSPTLGDLDKDGDLEIVVQGFDRRMHAWHHDGTPLTGWPISGDSHGIHRGGWGTPALADLDEDGELEIIIGSDDFPTSPPPYLLYAFNVDGTVLPGFPVQGSNNFGSSPAIGDIDGDGHLDIVAGGGRYESASNLYAWDRNGSPLAGWPQSLSAAVNASPALADLDNDGDLEVISGCGRPNDISSGNYCKQVYAFHGNGASVANFPVTIPDALMSFAYAPVVADIDGDNDVEILISEYKSNGPYIIHKNGQVDRSLRQGAFFFNAPLVDDVDNDNQLEVVMASISVYIWDVNGAADGELPWPMFHQNVMRTGLVPQQADISGTVTEPGGAALSGVTLTLNTGPTQISNATGAYTFQDLDPGTYTVTPSLAGYTFNPANVTVTVPPDATEQNFEVIYNSIAGKVIGSNGLPMTGVTVSENGGKNVVTDQDGKFMLEKLNAGSYTFAPTTATGFSSGPANRQATVPPSATGQNFAILPDKLFTAVDQGSGSLTFTDTQNLPTSFTWGDNTFPGLFTLTITPTLPYGQGSFSPGGGTLNPGSETFVAAGHAFDMETELLIRGSLDQPMTVAIHYSDDDIRTVSDEDALYLMRWAGSAWQEAAQTCTPLSTYTRDTTNNVVSVAVCETGNYVLFGPTTLIYLPLVLK